MEALREQLDQTESTVDIDRTDIIDIEGENSHIVSFVARKIKP